MFDPTKPVQTRDGKKCRIICTDQKGNKPIVALVPDSYGAESPVAYYEGGFYLKVNPSSFDLVNVPEKTYKYRVIFKDGYTTMSSFETIKALKNRYPSKQLYVLSIARATYINNVPTGVDIIPWESEDDG